MGCGCLYQPDHLYRFLGIKVAGMSPRVLACYILPPSLKWRGRVWLRLLGGITLLCLLAPDVFAVFTWGSLTTRRIITMQVGSATPGSVNSVTFDVSNSAVSPSPVAITGTPSNTPGTPATSPSNGVYVRMTAQIPTVSANSWTSVVLTVDSSAGLACVGGSGCGSTIIPSNTISWTSYDKDTTYAGLDIQDGAFNGSASQTLTNFYVAGGSLTMSNVLVFQYANSTLYPAGQYRGRVTYTASMP